MGAIGGRKLHWGNSDIPPVPALPSSYSGRGSFSSGVSGGESPENEIQQQVVRNPRGPQGDNRGFTSNAGGIGGGGAVGGVEGRGVGGGGGLRGSASVGGVVGLRGLGVVGRGNSGLGRRVSEEDEELGLEGEGFRTRESLDL